MKNSKLVIFMTCLAIASVSACENDSALNTSVRWKNCVGLEGQTYCQENAIVVCDMNSVVVSETPCDDGMICVGSAAGVACECTIEANKCSNGVATVCNTSTGQFEEMRCSSGECDGNACKYNECDGNATKCEAAADGSVKVSKCDNGKWVDSDVDCADKVCDSDNKTCIAKQCEYTKADGSSVQIKDGQAICDGNFVVSCKDFTITKDNECAIGICVEDSANGTAECVARGCDVGGATLEDGGAICAGGKKVTCRDGQTDGENGQGVDCSTGWVCADGENDCRLAKDCTDPVLGHLQLMCDTNHDVVECYDGQFRIADDCDYENADETLRTMCSSQNKCESIDADDCEFGNTLVKNGDDVCDGNVLRHCEVKVLSDGAECVDPKPVCDDNLCRAYDQCNIGTPEEPNFIDHNTVTCLADASQKARCTDGTLVTFDANEADACVAHQFCKVDGEDVICVCDTENHWVDDGNGVCVCENGWDGDECDCDLSMYHYDPSVGCVECLSNTDCASEACRTDNVCMNLAASFVEANDEDGAAYLRYVDELGNYKISDIKLIVTDDASKAIKDWDAIDPIVAADNTAACTDSDDTTKCGVDTALDTTKDQKEAVADYSDLTSGTYYAAFLITITDENGENAKVYVTTSLSSDPSEWKPASLVNDDTVLEAGQYQQLDVVCANDEVKCDGLQPMVCVDRTWKTDMAACTTSVANAQPICDVNAVANNYCGFVCKENFHDENGACVIDCTVADNACVNSPTGCSVTICDTTSHVKTTTDYDVSCKNGTEVGICLNDTYQCNDDVRQVCNTGAWTDNACTTSLANATVSCDATSADYCKVACNTGWTGTNCDIATSENPNYCTADVCDGAAIKHCDSTKHVWTSTDDCPVPEHGSATCNNVVCGIACDDVYHLNDAGNACVQECSVPGTTYENNASKLCVESICSADGHLTQTTAEVSCNANNTGNGECVNDAAKCDAVGSNANATFTCVTGLWSKNVDCYGQCSGNACADVSKSLCEDNVLVEIAATGAFTRMDCVNKASTTPYCLADSTHNTASCVQCISADHCSDGICSNNTCVSVNAAFVAANVDTGKAVLRFDTPASGTISEVNLIYTDSASSSLNAWNVIEASNNTDACKDNADACGYAASLGTNQQEYIADFSMIGAGDWKLAIEFMLEGKLFVAPVNDNGAMETAVVVASDSVLVNNDDQTQYRSVSMAEQTCTSDADCDSVGAGICNTTTSRCEACSDSGLTKNCNEVCNANTGKCEACVDVSTDPTLINCDGVCDSMAGTCEACDNVDYFCATGVCNLNKGGVCEVCNEATNCDGTCGVDGLCHKVCGASATLCSAPGMDISTEACCESTELCSSSGFCFTPGDECTKDTECAIREYCDIADGASTGYCILRLDNPKMCVSTPSVYEYAPELEWSSSNETNEIIRSTPVVADLTGDGIPEIVYIDSYLDSSFGSDREGYLVARDGATGRRLDYVKPSSVDDKSTRFNKNGDLALADIDHDGKIEVLVGLQTKDENETKFGLYVMNLEKKGTTTYEWKQKAAFLLNTNSFDSDVNGIFADLHPTIADLDQDGWPEVVTTRGIIKGKDVYDHLNDETWLSHAAWSCQYTEKMGQFGALYGYMFAVADLDQDGQSEIITDNAIYDVNCNKSEIVTIPSDDITSSEGEGYVAVADMVPSENAEGELVPELVRVSTQNVNKDVEGTVSLWRVYKNGTTWSQKPVWKVTHPGKGGGNPVIADLDGDGLREIGVAANTAFAVFKNDGEILWKAETKDPSYRTGAAVFDFEADGTAEIVYRDTMSLRVYGYDKTTKAVKVLWETSNKMTSETVIEYPLIVDVDGDGQTEIVATSDRGLHVYGDPKQKWVSARKIWNQHSYHVTNINDDGSVPQHEEANWLNKRLNNYRANMPVDDFYKQPNFVPSMLVEDKTKCNATKPKIGLEATVVNLGEKVVDSDIQVSFYVETPDGSQRYYLGTKAVEGLALGLEEKKSVIFYWDMLTAYPISGDAISTTPVSLTDISGYKAMFTVDDSANTGLWVYDECKEDDNVLKVSRKLEITGCNTCAFGITDGVCNECLRDADCVATTNASAVCNDAHQCEYTCTQAGNACLGVKSVSCSAVGATPTINECTDRCGDASTTYPGECVCDYRDADRNHRYFTDGVEFCTGRVDRSMCHAIYTGSETVFEELQKCSLVKSERCHEDREPNKAMCVSDVETPPVEI